MQVSPRPFYTPMDLSPPVLALDGGAGAAAEWEAKALLEAVKLSVLRARWEEAAGRRIERRPRGGGP